MNRFAITSTEIGEALQRSASALNEGGNTIDESIGLITGGQTVVQNAEKVGTALKTLSLRLRGAKVELEEAGLETDGMAESTSRLRDQLLGLTGGKVDIMLDENTFKSTTDILREMSKVWSSLNDIDSAAALELMGGKQQANVLAAIIQNFDIVEDAIETSADSAGSALRENEKYLDSIQGKIDQFNNAVQTMWSNTLDDSLIKGIVEFGTELIKLIDKIGLVKTSLGAWGLSKLIPWFLKCATDAKTFGGALKVLAFGADSASISSFQLVSSIVKLFAETTKGIPAMVSFGYQMQGLSGAASQLGKGISMAWAAIPGVGKIMLIAAAIGAVVAIVDAATDSTEELVEELATLQSELTEIQSEFSLVNDELQTTQDRIDELLQKDKLSFVEEEELEQLQKTNNELQRQVDLLELKEKQKKQAAADKFVKTMKSDVEDYGEYYSDGSEAIWYSDLGFAFEGTVPDKISESEKIEQQLKLYEDYQQKKTQIEQEIITLNGSDDQKQKELEQEKKRIDEKLANIQEYINGKTDEWSKNINGIDYGINPEADKWLDYIADIEDKWSIISGGTNAKSNAINRIFDKEEFSDVSTEINGLVEQLENGADETTVQEQIEGLILENEGLVAKLGELGISTDEAARHFSQFGDSAEDAVIEESSITDSLSKITLLEDAFNALGEAVQEFKEDGTAAADTLESLKDTFGTTEGFEELYKVLATGEGNVEEAITNVANAYITQKDILSDLTDEERQIMIARLKSLGVINAEALVNNRTNAQEQLNDRLEGYNIDLSAYATAEAAKAAIAQQTKIDVSSIVGDTIEELETKYGMDLSAFASVEAAKVKVAKETAKKIAMTDNNKQIAALNKEFTEKGYTGSEKYRSEEYKTRKQEIIDNYNATVAEIDAINENTYADINSIVDSYYNTVAQFNFSGNKIGIGRDYDEEIDDGSDDAEDKAKDELDKLRKKYENRISHLENQQTYLENEIEKLEAQDKQVGKGVYEEQIRLEEEKINLYEQERAALLDKMKGVAKDSDIWQEYADSVWEVEHAIQESALAVLEFKQNIADLYIDLFDKTEDAFNSQQELYDKQADYIRNNIEYAELNKQDIPASAYKDLIAVQENKYASALDEIAALENALNLGVNTDGVEFSEKELADLVLRLQDAKLEAQEARNEMASINDELKGLYVTAFNKVGEAYDALGSLYEDRASYVEGYMELQQLRGDSVSAGSYDYLIGNTNNILNANLSALDTQRQKISEAMANGVQEGSEEWIEMQAEIRSTEAAIQDCYIKLEQYNEELKNLYSEAFNKVRDSFSDVTDVYNDQQAFIDSYINYLETLGVKVPAEMYEKLGIIELEKQHANMQKLADMQDALAKMEAEGYTPEDEEWVQAQADIRAVEKAIWDSEAAMAEYNKRIREMETEKFEEFIKRITDMVSELDRVYNLLSKEDVATEDGVWTEEGIASLGLLYQKMEISKKQVAEYQEEIEKLNKEYESGAISEQEYNDRLVELKNSQWDSIEAYEDAKDAIVDINESRIDMIEEGINEEIEAYQELIDLKKKELDAERDLYEFRKNIQKQTKDITSLERRIASMSGSTDAATIAERTKLEAQLEEARESLSDTYYTHAMDSQSTALNDENESYVKSKEDYVEMLREALKDVESIVANTMSQVLINSDTVLGELNDVSGEYGVTLSESLTAPWIKAAQYAEEFKNSALMQEYDFTVQNGIFTGEITQDFSDMFAQTTGMANQFNTDVYTVMEAIKLHVNTSTSEMTSDLIIPFNTALAYATNTFSPTVIGQLQTVANKAESLVYTESNDITAPWRAGTEAANTFGAEAEDTLKEVADKAKAYSPTTANALTTPPKEAGSAWSLFGDKVKGIFDALITKAQQAATDIGGDMQGIIENAKKAANAIVNTGSTTPPAATKPTKQQPQSPASTTTNSYSNATKALQQTLNVIFKAGIDDDGYWGPKTESALRFAQITMKHVLGKPWVPVNGKYDSDTRTAMIQYIDYLKSVGRGMDGAVYDMQKKKLPAAFYAKGTTGTKRDEWAITDEIGDELVMYATPQGTLSYMRAGSTVVPADLTKNLMEWGKLNPNVDMSGAVQGVNLMSNVINKPELNLKIDNLLRCDNVSHDTLPELKKFVAEELDKFTRNLNYSLRRVGAK